MTPQAFVERWKDSAGAELANSQSFLKELCQLLELPEPDPTRADEAENVYTFEKAVKFNNGDGTTSDGRVDLYRKGCFVLESKQGSELAATPRS
ncbi:MAG: type IIL restriction-modification enzyme MmeI [Planctomycetaceae bacterium]